MDKNTVKSLKKCRVNRATFPSSGRRNAVNASCSYTRNEERNVQQAFQAYVQVVLLGCFRKPPGGKRPRAARGSPIQPVLTTLCHQRAPWHSGCGTGGAGHHRKTAGQLQEM